MLELVVLSYSGMHPLRLSFDHIFCYALYHNIGVAPDFVYHAPHHIAFLMIGYSHPMWFELAPHLHQWALHALLYLVDVHGPSIRFLISDSYFSGRTVLINDTFISSPNIQRRLDPSRGSRPTYSRLDPSPERRPYPLLPTSRPLTGETCPYFVLSLLPFVIPCSTFSPLILACITNKEECWSLNLHYDTMLSTPFLPRGGVMNHQFRSIIINSDRSSSCDSSRSEEASKWRTSVNNIQIH